MSEFRKNPFTGEMTLYAENRKNRPYEFRHQIQTKQADAGNCPFCGGHEAQTEKAIYQDAADDAWQVRVFPNRYPAVFAESAPPQTEPFYENANGIGRHEVLVDTRIHEKTIESFSVPHLAQILAVLQQRSREIAQDAAYVQIFKNCGPSAGMSIRHSHWQLVGLPILPPRIHKMAEKMENREGECLFCKMLAYEQEQKSRIAGETAHFIAVAPYASRFPYELWLAPKRHQRAFADLDETQREELAAFLLELLQKIIGLQREIGYNICVMDAPKGMDFHWHIEIYPRIGGSAGFEYATDCIINPVLPEKAAAYYCK